MGRLTQFLLSWLALVLTGCRLVGQTVPTPSPTPAPQAAATPTPLGQAVLAPLDVEEQLITNLYERVGPSVVHVTARIVSMSFFFGPMASEGTGSGFVFDREGHIVTNYHVIEGAESVEVVFSDDTSVAAQVVGVDPPNDLAVLQVNVPRERLFPVTLGQAESVRVGQRAIAIGNPFGLDRTLTTGVVSAMGRPLQTDTDSYIYEVIQTDAAINPGNSGGPLLNSRGELIGVNTAVRQGAEGIGFAVPVDTVRRVVPALIEQGFYPHPWLGFLGYDITPELAADLQLAADRGILVAQVYRDGPAHEAGLRGGSRQAIVGNRRLILGGDVVTAVDGTPVDGWSQLNKYLEFNVQVGDPVALTVWRDGRTLSLTLTAIAQPQ